MTKLWQQFNTWLDAHPWWHGLVVAIESSALGALGSVADDFIRGKDIFSAESLHKTVAFMVAAVVIGIRNYLKQSPIPALQGPPSIGNPAVPPEVSSAGSATTKGIQ